MVTQDDLDTLVAKVGSSDPGTPNNHNLVGAINQLDALVDELAAYDISDAANAPADKQADLADAQEDLQVLAADLLELADKIAGDDGAVTDADGNTVLELPRAASERASEATIADTTPPSND